MDPQLMEKKNDSLYTSVDERKFRRARYSSRNDIIHDPAQAFMEKYGQSLYNIIKTTVFEDGEDNWATKTFAILMAENKPAATKLIYTYYVRNVDDERMCVKLLKMLYDYTYDEFLPYSREMAASGLVHDSIRVRSAAFSLMDHWGNEESLELLNTVEVPTEAWLQMKYDRIKTQLEKKWSTHAR